MNMAAQSIPVPDIAIEWQRVELLAQCLLSTRQGHEPGEDSLKRLGHLQQSVYQLRQTQSQWNRLPVDDLPSLALDLLACIYSPDIQPRVGWLYQELQGGAPQPYATPALLQMLLALDDDEMPIVQDLLGREGSLTQRALVSVEQESAFSPVKPGPGMIGRLTQGHDSPCPPPGAIRVRKNTTWSQLILPPDRIRMLQEFLCCLRHAEKVAEAWGGEASGGPVALFSGPSGTGKTFAASVIANELGWPLYRVDLGQLVSKYIGETEKNIGRLLDAAHGRELVLQFDEADALMSKRGEIKEARDRYANMEVSYLLARIEEHKGPCILTTNLRSQIDKAFARRFQIVVEFPRPDRAAREELWRLLLPPKAPLAEDVDSKFLAASTSLTGGNIRNAALHAAYLAADEDSEIKLSHIATGIWRELATENTQATPSDLGALADHLPGEVNGHHQEQSS